VVITFPAALGLYATQTLATIEDVHRVMESQPGVGNVWSLESLRRWLAEQMGLTGASALRQYVDILPHFLVRRFVAEDEKSVVVFGLVPDNKAVAMQDAASFVQERDGFRAHDFAA
jgi:hypothetical protein